MNVNVVIGRFSGIVGQIPNNWTDSGSWEEVLEPVYRDGTLLRYMNFNEVRENAKK